MYALDVHNRKLLRVGGDGPKVESELELGPGVTSCCLTPDGKKLYACSSSNRIDEIDAASFKPLRSVRFGFGQPTDVAATNEGLCYLAGRGAGTDPFSAFGLVVDVGRAKGERAEAAELGVRCHTAFAVMLPDQRAVLLCGDRRVNVCSVSSRPTVFRTAHTEALYDGYNNPARAWVSPDGRTLLWDRGQIVSISR